MVSSSILRHLMVALKHFTSGTRRYAPEVQVTEHEPTPQVPSCTHTEPVPCTSSEQSLNWWENTEFIPLMCLWIKSAHLPNLWIGFAWHLKKMCVPQESVVKMIVKITLIFAENSQRYFISWAGWTKNKNEVLTLCILVCEYVRYNVLLSPSGTFEFVVQWYTLV